MCVLEGNPDEADPDENVCHVSLGDVCHVRGGVPTHMDDHLP